MPFPFLPPEEIDRIDSVLARLRDVGRGDYELTLMRGDGSRFPALLSSGSIESAAATWATWSPSATSPSAAPARIASPSWPPRTS